MNVIIRLQNLPWSANASDIRLFFRGLQIPEGGVHIVGGEDGDAFIAFSTDEDARQAMSMSKMKLKETQVTLLLSSRAEMQKVIEKARAASSGFAQMAKAAQSSMPTPEAFTNQFATKKIAQNPVAIQQPVIAANYMQAQVAQSILPTAYQIASNGIPGLGGGVNPNAAIFFNPVDYMKLVNQQPQIIQTNSDPRSRDPREKNRDPRDQARYKKEERQRERSRSPYSSDERRERRRKTRFSSPEKKLAALAANVSTSSAIPPHLALIQQQQHQQVAYSTNQQLLNQQLQQQTLAAFTTNQVQLPIVAKPSMPTSGIWDVPPAALNLNAYSSYNGIAQPARNYQTTSDSNNYQSSSLQTSSIGTCVKISNVDKETTYGDIRKFFGGLPIGNNDIKFITDSQGNPSGVALIRFVSSDSKKQSLTKNGWQLKSTQIMITPISEEDFECGLENAVKARYENKRSLDDGKRDRFRNRERSDSRDRDQGKDRYRQNDRRNFGNRGNDHDNPNNRRNNNRNNNFRRDDNYDKNDRRNFNNNRDRNQENDSNSNDQPQQQQQSPKVEYTPDENFQVLIIDDIPRVSNAEIFEAFPKIVSISIVRYTAYCKFNSHDDAKSLLEDRFSHFIKGKRVFIEKGSEAQFTDVVKKHGRHENSVMKSNNSSENGDENSQQSGEDKQMSRDPRQRSNQPQNGDSYRNNLKTDCVIIKRMDRSATIEDVEFFLSDVDIPRNQIRIHILLDRRGQPSGDCFVEFQFEDDMQRALTKNNMFIGQNRVEVLPIPREQVNAVLNSFGNNSNGNGNDSASQPSYQQQRRDWGPPPDFGLPECVVMLSNLSYRATIQEIVDAFKEFDVKAENIIRRFNDNGQPTGMACINFATPEDAAKACEDYNKTLISNRPVWLRRA